MPVMNAARFVIPKVCLSGKENASVMAATFNETSDVSVILSPQSSVFPL